MPSTLPTNITYPSFGLVLADKLDSHPTSASRPSSAVHRNSVPDFRTAEFPPNESELSQEVGKSFSSLIVDLEDVLSTSSDKSGYSRRARKMATLVIDLALAWKRKLLFRRSKAEAIP